MDRADRPARCWVTKFGVVLFCFSTLCFAGIWIVQYAKTGSFARGSGFVMGPYLAMPMLYSFVAAVMVLVVGGLVDVGRQAKWKKEHGG